MVSRVERTPFANWWWTVDRLMLAALFALMLGGIVLSLAASPPVAARLGLEPFYFVNRHVLYLVPTIGVLLVTSFLPVRYIRRIALVVFIVSLVLVALTLVYGVEVKGARRWLVILGVNIQPSEFLKPAFVMLIAWLFGESARRPEMPANTIALGLLLVSVVALVLQPDFGQTMLIALVWGILFFLAGMRHDLGRRAWRRGRRRASAVAYVTIPHVARRIKRFLDPSSGDTFNVDQALESFLRGGWFGRGPGEGTVKRALPESHADFVFAVAAEEFGIVLCLVLVALFAFIVLRALSHAMRNEDPFRRFAAAGLAILFGLQSAINMAVNVHLMPAKGMTLPFISYGGSSMISLAWGMGMLLALDARAPADAKSCRITRRAGSGRERGLMASTAGPVVLLAAGGTGGHLFPAEALAAALARRGITVDLATDARGGRYGGKFPARQVHVIPSETVRGRNPIALARTGGHARHRLHQGLSRARPRPARRRGRLRRLSDRCRRSSRRRCARFRRSSTSRTPSWAAPTGCWRARVSAIATSFAGVLDAEPRSPPRRRASAIRCGRR